MNVCVVLVSNCVSKEGYGIEDIDQMSYQYAQIADSNDNAVTRLLCYQYCQFDQSADAVSINAGLNYIECGHCTST